MPDAPDIALGKAFTQGTGLYNMLMQHAIQRAQSKRMDEQNQRAAEMQPYNIKKIESAIANANAANARQQAMLNPRLQALKDSHDKYVRESDPNYEINEANKWIHWALDQGASPEEATTVANHAIKNNIDINKVQKETESELPSINQAMGKESFIASAPTMGAQQIKQDDEETTASESNKNNKYNALRQKLKAGILKKKTGIDLNAETPDEKEERQLRIFKEKKDIESQYPGSKGGMTSEQREKDLSRKQQEIDEKIRHNRELEKNANLEQKLQYNKELIQLKKEKEMAVNEQKQLAEYQKSLDKEQAKIYVKMQEEGMAGLKANPSYKNLKSIISDPLFKSIRQHPSFPNLEMKALKKVGSKEQQHLIGAFENATKEIIADMAKGLNSRFTNKDLQLAEDMKISPSDSYQSALAKAESILFLHEIGQQRLDKAIRLIHDTKEEPYFAMKQADALIDGDKIRKQIRDDLGLGTKKTMGTNKQYYSPNQMVKVDMGNGVIKEMTYSEALKIGAEHG